MYHVAICDDESVFIDEIEIIIKHFAKEYDYPLQLHSFQNSTALLDEIVDGSVFDIYLLDVDMPGVGGFELAKKVKEKQPEAPIIFLTSHVEMSREGYKVDALRFVSKLCLDAEIDEALNAAFFDILNARNPFLNITHYHDVVRVPYNEILYVQRVMRYLEIHTSRQGIITTGRSIKDVLAKLDDERFVFISRSCFVNLDHVRQLSESSIKMDTNESLPISRKMLPGVKSTILRVWGEQA